MLVAVLYIALAVACYWHMWSGGVAHMSFPDGDQYLNMWNLDWFAFALVHGHNPFFSAWINHPHGANLLTNTGEALLGLLATPVTLLWGPVAAFNVMMTLALSASAFGGYLLARRFVGWAPAAVAAGLVYGFGPYAIAQGDAHLNLAFIALPPLIVLQLWRVLAGEARPVTGGVLLGVLVVGQFFVSTELLADTAVIAAVGLLLVLVAGRHQIRDLWREAGTGLAVASVVAVAVLSYPLWYALGGPQSITGPIQLAPSSYRADLLGTVVPGIFQAVAPRAAVHSSELFAGNVVENGSYLGIPLLVVLVLAVVVLRRRIEAWVAAVLGVVAILLSLGDRLVVTGAPGAAHGGIVLPGWGLFHLPLFSNAVPARFSFLGALFAGFVLALLLDERHQRLAASGRHRRHRALRAASVPAVVGALALAPLVPAIPYSGVADLQPPALYLDVHRILPPGAPPVVVYPYADNGNAMAMLWQAQTFMAFRMPGGNLLVPGPSGRESLSTLGSAPPTATGLALAALALGHLPPETPATRSAIAGELASWHVRAVLASPATAVNPAQATSFLTWLLGPPAPAPGNSLVWRLR